MTIPERISSAREMLRSESDYAWDADDGMPDEAVWRNPIGRLVAAYQSDADRDEALKWLTLFVARRALPCWDLYCDDTLPRDAIQVGEQWLTTGERPALISPFATPAKPAYRGRAIHDCRACDTGCAADAAAQFVQFLETDNPLTAIYCISSADAAFDQSPLVEKDHFRAWLIDFAIPRSFDRRDMTVSDQNALREYDPSTISQDRELEADYWNGPSP